MNELKPCPFCGAQVKLMAIAGEPYPPTYEVNLGTVSEDSDDICYVHCPTCGANWHIEVRVDAFPMDTIAAWNRRPAPENNPLTNFSHIIESPESLGKFLQAINNGYIHFDNIYCHAQCDDDDNCPHELQCIINWLNQPYARKPEQEEK